MNAGNASQWKARGGERIVLRFINQSETGLILLWIDYDGIEARKRMRCSLGPGGACGLGWPLPLPPSTPPLPPDSPHQPMIPGTFVLLAGALRPAGPQLSPRPGWVGMPLAAGLLQRPLLRLAGGAGALHPPRITCPPSTPLLLLVQRPTLSTPGCCETRTLGRYAVGGLVVWCVVAHLWRDVHLAPFPPPTPLPPFHPPPTPPPPHPPPRWSSNTWAQLPASSCCLMASRACWGCHRSWCPEQQSPRQPLLRATAWQPQPIVAPQQ